MNPTYLPPPRYTRAGAAAFVIEQFRELGLNPENSRLGKVQRVLNRSHEGADLLTTLKSVWSTSNVRVQRSQQGSDFLTALESLRDLHQLEFIFRQLEKNDTRFTKNVKRILKDSALPQDDPMNSQGRDYQFELYLAAICQNAGLVPVDFGKQGIIPDITCSVDGTRFGIEAKRLKSARLKSTNISKLKKHVEKAADQLKARGLPGIVALDLTLFRNRHNLPIISRIQSQMYRMISDAKNIQFQEQHGDAIRRWVAGTGVKAVLILESTLRLRPDGQWGHDGMLSWLPTTVNDEQADPLFESFYKGFLKGVPNLEDSSAEG